MLAEVIIAHTVGDYVIQSDWMAQEKTKKWLPAVVHGASYTLPFIVITQSWLALLVIFSTHAVIDHYRLARYVVWFKNQAAPREYRYSWKLASPSGYSDATPVWMGVWLMIITDNIMHILINAAAVHWL